MYDTTTEPQFEHAKYVPCFFHIWLISRQPILKRRQAFSVINVTIAENKAILLIWL